MRLNYRILLAFLGICYSIIGLGSNDLPNLGNPSHARLPLALETKMGNEYMAELQRHGAFLADPIADEYIQRIGKRLTETQRNSYYKYTFFITRSQNINAFAVPGGFIGVNAGLILESQNESELAAVISHEISHVNQGHIAEMMGEGKKTNMATLAGILASAAMAYVSPEAASGLMMGTMAGREQQRINFTRGQEIEADRIGILMLIRAGFDPSSMITFFERLARQERYYPLPPAILRDHPITEDRIAEARTVVEKIPKQHYRHSLTYELVKSRLKIATANDPHAAIDKFENTQAKGNKQQKIAHQYGYALGLNSAGETGQALKIFKKLSKQKPNNRILKLSLASAYSNNNQDVKALKIFQELYSDYPSDYLINVSLASCLTDNKQPVQAIDVLESYILDYPNGKKPWYQLADAQAKAGLNAQAYETRAKYYVSQKDWQAAVIQLQQALKVRNIDPATDRRINAKIHAFKSHLSQ